MVSRFKCSQDFLGVFRTMVSARLSGYDFGNHKSHGIAVVVIVFRRPYETRGLVNAILASGATELFVIADGPRSQVATDVAAVKEVRTIFDELEGLIEVHRIFSDVNLGLRERVISGLDQVFSQREMAVILEDDCLPSPDFFAYCQTLLLHHERNERVGIISGNNFGPELQADQGSYWVSSHPHIWGWATWRRVWGEFRAQAADDSVAIDRTALGSLIPGKSTRRNFLRLFDKKGSLDSWAIDFTTFCYRNRLLSLVPGKNLVKNVGFGRGSTHTKFESFVHEVEARSMDFPISHPKKIEVDLFRLAAEEEYTRKQWWTHPLRHPLDTLGRFNRYLWIVAAGLWNRLPPGGKA